MTQFSSDPSDEQRLPPHDALFIKVLKVEDGWQAFLVQQIQPGIMADLLPMNQVPAMPSYREAEELAIVVADQLLDSYRDSNGQLMVGVMD